MKRASYSKNGIYRLIAGPVGTKSAEIAGLFLGKKISKAAAVRSARAINRLVDQADREYFVSYSIENSRLMWFWASRVAPDTFDGKTILVEYFVMDPRIIAEGMMEKLSARARAYHKAWKYRIKLKISPSEAEQLPLLERHGFKIAFHALSAKTGDSLKYLALKNKTLPEGYALAELDPEKDLEKYLRVQIRALKSDKSSSMHYLPECRISEIFCRFHSGKSENIFFGLYFRKRLVGGIAVSIENWPPKMGLIGSIGILPEHTGKGLSVNLYHAGLSWLKRKNIARYIGVSSTRRVLLNVGKMKRKIAVTNLKSA